MLCAIVALMKRVSSVFPTVRVVALTFPLACAGSGSEDAHTEDGISDDDDDDDNDADGALRVPGDADGSPTQDSVGIAGGDTTLVTCVVPVSHPTIQAAENDVSCTTVQVNPGVYFENVVIDRDLTIVATVWSTVTIDGGTTGRVVDNLGANVVLRGVSIMNGAASSGAGIRSVGSLEVYESLIMSNVAQGIDAVGGGIQAEGDVLLDDTIVYGNTVRAQAGSATVGGGGVYITAGDLVVTNTSTVERNLVTVANLANCDARGGGIYAIEAGVFVDGKSAVFQNTASVTASPAPWASGADGGGVHIRGDGSSFTLTDGRVAANLALIDRGRAAGGGMYSVGTALDIGTAATIRNNTARANLAGVAMGGGIVHEFSETLGQQAPFVIEQAVVHGNSALSAGNAAGGAVYTFADVGDAVITVVDTSMYNNRAFGVSDGRAGAIEAQATCCNNQSTTLEIIDSTLSGNLSSGGSASAGGVFLFAAAASEAHLVVVNSTLSGNVATAVSSVRAFGGAIVVGAEAAIQTTTLEIANSTIANNTATGPYTSGGGGIYAPRQGYSGPTNIDIRNSIVYGNTATTGPDCATSLVTVTSGGFNIFGNTAGCTIAGATANDLVGVDPLLGALAPNGGPTLTRMIAAGSPAQNAANPGGCTGAGNLPLTTDQRGSARPVGAACDIGAIER